MMLEFLRLLVFVRTEANSNYSRFILWLSSISVISFVSSILVDMLLPWNSITMFIRCFIALIFGISFAFLIYGMKHKKSQLLPLEESIKEDIRLKYSHNQRINIAIISIVSLITLHLLLIKQETLIYTFSTSLIIFIGTFLLIFIRPTKDEVIRSRYGIEDMRDLEHDRMIEYFKQQEENHQEK